MEIRNESQHEKSNLRERNDNVKSAYSWILHNFTLPLLYVKFSFTAPLRVHIKLA